MPVLPRDHALASADAAQSARSAQLAQVLQEPFIGLAADSALQALVNAQARRLGHTLHYRARLGHLEAVCRLVGLGAGVAVVPQVVARRHARALHIRVVRLADAWARRSLVLCMRDRDALPPFTRELVAHLQPPLS